MAIEVTLLHEHVGALVDGVDLREPVAQADFDAIEAALDAHSVVVLRDQPLGDEALISFAALFGRLVRTRKGAVGEGGDLVVLSNLDAKGNVVAPGHKQLFDARANQLWHSDASFRPVPAYASLLLGRTIAPRGGQTEFAAMRVAYQALNDEMRARVDGLRSVHHFAHSRSLVEPGRLEQAEADHLPPVTHPLVRPHSRTGMPALYLGAHLREILGLPLEEGRQVARELLAHATRPSHVYVHEWQRDYLVIGDNSAGVHRGRPWDEHTAPRHMVRATVADDDYELGRYLAH